MNKSLRTIHYLLIACASLNWSGQESTSGKERPQLNFKGILTDSSDQTFHVENITISGLYKNIPFYALPTQPEMRPEDNVTLINLAEVDAIKSVPRNEHKVTFNGRSYNKIIISLKNANEGTYLVETSRKIFCDIAINKNSIEKRLAFEALKELIITNLSRQDDVQAMADTQPKAAAGHERECAQAGRALHRLNEEAQKVSGPQKNVLLELVDSVKNWVGSICSVPAKE